MTGSSRSVTAYMSETRGEWVVYGPGDSLYCPGTYRSGDRRVGSCRRNWGRAGASTETWLRVKRRGQAPAPGPTMGLYCDECERPIELLSVGMTIGE
jgi:hypothetical protein